jgi:hypothetical protein
MYVKKLCESVYTLAEPLVLLAALLLMVLA